jgi:uncharacterized protein YkwD
MKMKHVILVCLLVPVLVSAGSNKLFNKLNKWYKKDSERCYELAKELIKKTPTNVVPYYFITIIHKDQYMSTSTLNGQYSNMTYALFYGAYFDSKSQQTLKSQVGWSGTKKVIETEAIKLIDLLLANNQLDKCKKIAKKLHNLNTLYPELPVQLVPALTEAYSENNFPKEGEVINEWTDGGYKMYFGMPAGNENVLSHNVESETAMLKIINEARKSKGLKPLVMDERLCKAARYHAYDMATQNYFDHNTHDRVNGKLQKVGGTFDRIKMFYSDSFVNSENIAAGNESPKDTYMQWFNSKGHYRNMFNKESRKVGIGFVYVPNSTYSYYWVFCSAQ